MKFTVYRRQEDNLQYVASVNAYQDYDIVREMREWCNSSFGDKWGHGIWSWGFENESDRTMFLLRWTSEI